MGFVDVAAGSDGLGGQCGVGFFEAFVEFDAAIRVEDGFVVEGEAVEEGRAGLAGVAHGQVDATELGLVGGECMIFAHGHGGLELDGFLGMEEGLREAFETGVDAG